MERNGSRFPASPDYKTDNNIWSGLSEGLSGSLPESSEGGVRQITQPDGDLQGIEMEPGGSSMDGLGMDMAMDYIDLLCMSSTKLDFNLSSIDFLPPGLFNMSICNEVQLKVSANPEDFDALHQIHYAALVVVLYIVVILLGAIGNTMVVITVVKTKQMWNATNIFIANLAISDVFVCVFDLPLSVYYQITDKWIFGEILCHVIFPAFAVVVYDSTLTLTLISIDRYLLIVFPLKRKFTVRLALLLVAVMAAISIAVALPIALYSKYIVWDDPELNFHKQLCTEKWPSARQRLIYTVVTLIFQYFLPLLVIGILYFLIFRRVRQRMTSSKKSRKTKTTKMLVAVVTVFAVAWTPYHLYALISEVNYDLVKGYWYRFTDALLRVVAMSSSCINPILYAWLNDNYKNAFLSLIKVKGRKGQPLSFQKEESCESTARSLVQANNSSASPKRRNFFLRKLTLNGKLNPVTQKVEHVALRDVRNGGQNGALLTNRPSSDSLATSPLLKHKEEKT